MSQRNMPPEEEFLDSLTRVDEQLQILNRNIKTLVSEQKKSAEAVKKISGESSSGETPPVTNVMNAEFMNIPKGPPGNEIKLLLPNGENIFDLKDGQVHLADGTDGRSSRGISQMGEDELWSMLMWVDNDCTVKIGAEDSLSSPFYVDQATYLSIEEWPFSKLSIEPTGSYETRIYAIASTFPRVPFDRLPVSTHQERVNTGVSTGSSWQTVREMRLRSFRKKSFHIHNTGSESVEVRIRARNNSNVGWATLVDRLTADSDEIASGNHFRYETEEAAGFFQVQVQNGSGQSTVDFEGMGVM